MRKIVKRDHLTRVGAARSDRPCRDARHELRRPAEQLEATEQPATKAALAARAAAVFDVLAFFVIL
jgi:hypothetical protein